MGLDCEFDIDISYYIHWLIFYDSFLHLYMSDYGQFFLIKTKILSSLEQSEDI